MTRPSLSAAFASSAIRRGAFHPGTGVLDIWYAGGDRYSYFNVPIAIWEGLLAAQSAGEFVNLHVKPHFRYEIEPGRRRFRPS